MIYLDPPYYVKGRELYVNFFKEVDHIAYHKPYNKENNLNWVITYDNHSFIHNLYTNAKSLSYAYRIVQEQISKGQSYFFCKQDIIIPEHLLPTLE